MGSWSAFPASSPGRPFLHHWRSPQRVVGGGVRMDRVLRGVFEKPAPTQGPIPARLDSYNSAIGYTCERQAPVRWPEA